jgi:sterol desaturase/sphingolipid hydroxylase (fatty acid hydroxylase superfamily)
MSELQQMHENLHAIWILPVAGALLMLAEWLYVRFVERADHRFDGGETAVSLGIAALDYGARPLVAGLMAAPIYWIYLHRPFDIPWNSLPGLVALVLVADLADYWFHRASHHVRALWAIHIVHHSPTLINLSSGVRLSCFAPLVSTIYWMAPLVFVGFHPIAVVTVVSAIQLYHFILHAAHTPSWGPFEWFMNTPTHHRVHHAINPSCVNRNFSTTFILWDRLFGTFASAPKDEPLRFGLPRPIPSRNPLTINFFEIGRVAADVLQAKGMRAKLRTLLRDPT